MRLRINFEQLELKDDEKWDFGRGCFLARPYWRGVDFQNQETHRISMILTGSIENISFTIMHFVSVKSMKMHGLKVSENLPARSMARLNNTPDRFIVF